MNLYWHIIITESPLITLGDLKDKNINTKENLPMYLHSVATNNSAGYKHCLILHCVWHSVLGIFINISFDVFYYLSHMLALFLGI